MLAICCTTDLSETAGCEVEARLPGEGGGAELTRGSGQHSVQHASHAGARRVIAGPIPRNPGGCGYPLPPPPAGDCKLLEGFTSFHSGLGPGL